jgi:hypothetical protein
MVPSSGRKPAPSGRTPSSFPTRQSLGCFDLICQSYMAHIGAKYITISSRIRGYERPARLGFRLTTIGMCSEASGNYEA